MTQVLVPGDTCRDKTCLLRCITPSSIMALFQLDMIIDWFGVLNFGRALYKHLLARTVLLDPRVPFISLDAVSFTYRHFDPTLSHPDHLESV